MMWCLGEYGVQRLGHGTQREVLRRQLSSVAGKKPSVSFSLFLETNNLEIEHELACAATCFWAEAVWMGQWEVDVREA